jgi:acyl carrier protein
MKVIDRVRAVIADALYLDAGEVQRESSLMKDLGAESIDFLDIMFRLEKEFGIKLPKGEVERRSRGGLSDAEFAVDGKLTPAAIQAVKAAMPEVNPAEFSRNLLLRDLPSLFTVATFERMVSEQLFGESVEGNTVVTPDAFPASRV